MQATQTGFPLVNLVASDTERAPSTMKATVEAGVAVDHVCDMLDAGRIVALYFGRLQHSE
eukprot:5213312-Pyramimonas_sp.AAC.1